MTVSWMWRTFGAVALGGVVAVAALTSYHSSSGRPAARTSAPPSASVTPSATPQPAAERERAFADLVDRVTNVAFAPDTPAYDVRNVDAFLDEVVTALHAGAPLPATRIKAAAAGFRSASTGVKGYSRSEVDAFMVELADRTDQLP